MPTNRVPVRRLRRGLSHDQEMSLWLGDHPYRPAFGSEQQRRAAWVRHRDRLMAAWAKHGKRPAGWWDYESPVPYPRDPDYDAATLFEAQLLADGERAELIAEWRYQFDRAQEPGFSFCIGHAKPSDTFASWLEGAAAKRAHYRWAGIPRSLLTQWTAERQTIHKLKAAAELPAT
jgi:hypothetical protein